MGSARRLLRVKKTAIYQLMYRLQDAIEHSERSITIDRRTKNLIIWLAKYVWDNTDKATKEMD